MVSWFLWTNICFPPPPVTNFWVDLFDSGIIKFRIILTSSSNTLLCLQVYLPLAKATLQELRTCSNVWGFSLHRGQVGSLSFFHLTRLLFDRSWPYVERIKKLNLSGAICQMLFKVIDFAVPPPSLSIDFVGTVVLFLWVFCYPLCFLLREWPCRGNLYH